MARTLANGIRLSADPPSSHRPLLCFPQPIFSAELGSIGVTQITPDTVLLTPHGFHLDEDVTEFARWQEEDGQYRCWKTVRVYEQIGVRHAHLVP
jgi:hypothetical protein